MQKTYTFTEEELNEIINLICLAKNDIWQFVRIAELNLSGKDPNFPDDSPIELTAPTLVSRKGLDESYAVHEQLSSMIRKLSTKEENSIDKF